MQGLPWLSIARDQTECPICDFLLARVPFVGPGEENGAGQSALDYAVDVPAQHFRLLVLTMSNRVHPKFAENERTLLSEILQTEEITFEIGLTMQVNIETKEIDILRQEKFGRRIGRVGIKRARINVATSVDEMLDELGDATHTEPANHLRRDFVADQIGEDGGVTGVHFDGV